jgi:hypothetical protein
MCGLPLFDWQPPPSTIARRPLAVQRLVTRFGLSPALAATIAPLVGIGPREDR